MMLNEKEMEEIRTKIISTGFMKPHGVPCGVLIECPHCKRTFEIVVGLTDFENFQKGMNVGEAFPYLNADLREMFLSQICPECWNEIFSTEEE